MAADVSGKPITLEDDTKVRVCLQGFFRRENRVFRRAAPESVIWQNSESHSDGGIGGAAGEVLRVTGLRVYWRQTVCCPAFEARKILLGIQANLPGQEQGRSETTPIQLEVQYE